MPLVLIRFVILKVHHELAADRIYLHILQSAADYELREKSVGSVPSMLHLDEPGLTQRSASATTVLTAVAIEGKVPLEMET